MKNEEILSVIAQYKADLSGDLDYWKKLFYYFEKIHEKQSSLYPTVTYRLKTNLISNKRRLSINKENFWQNFLLGLVTTRQKSGPKSKSFQFLQKAKNEYSLKVCLPDSLCFNKLVEEIPLRTSKNRATESLRKAVRELHSSDQKFWKYLTSLLNPLGGRHKIDDERRAADFLNNEFKGVGFKQSRNILQAMGVTQYVVPIDSRMLGALSLFHKLDFPHDNIYNNRCSDPYLALEDTIVDLSRELDIKPCIFDAYIFDSYNFSQLQLIALTAKI